MDVYMEDPHCRGGKSCEKDTDTAPSTGNIGDDQLNNNDFLRSNDHHASSMCRMMNEFDSFLNVDADADTIEDTFEDSNRNGNDNNESYLSDADGESAYNRDTRHIEDAIIQEELRIQTLESYLLTLTDQAEDEEKEEEKSTNPSNLLSLTLTATSVPPDCTNTLLLKEGIEKREENIVEEKLNHCSNKKDGDIHDSQYDIREIFRSIVPVFENTRTQIGTTTTGTTTTPITAKNHCRIPTSNTPSLSSSSSLPIFHNASSLLRNFTVSDVQFNDHRHRQGQYTYTIVGYFNIHPNVHTEIKVMTTSTASTTSNHNNKDPLEHNPTTGPTTTSTTTDASTMTKCTLWYDHSKTMAAGTGSTELPPSNHDDNWCRWLQQQIRSVVQEACGDDCDYVLENETCTASTVTNNNNNNNNSNNRNDGCNIHPATKQQSIGTTTMSSNSPYFLAAYITCIHEYLQYNYQRNALQQQLQQRPSANMVCPCGSYNQYRPTTVTHLSDYKSTLICIPIYQQNPSHQNVISNKTSIPFRQYKRCAIIDDEDDNNNCPLSPPRWQEPCGTISLICTWRFKERKCSLRLQNSLTHEYNTTTSITNKDDSTNYMTGTRSNNDNHVTNLLRQHDLDQFVAFCRNDICQTLTLLRKYCSACTCWKNYNLVPLSKLTSKINRSKQPKVQHSLPASLPIKRKRSISKNLVHQEDDDADDEGGEDYDDDDDDDEEDNGNNNNYDDSKSKSVQNHFNITGKHRKRTKINSMIRNNKTNGGNRIRSEQKRNCDQLSTSNDKDEENLEASLRLSPSGRRRSDYEVERLIRINRNERKLSQLGLLLPKDLSRGSNSRIGGDPTPKVTKRRRSRTRQKISVPLSPYRPSMNSNYYSEKPRIYPKRQVNNDEIQLPLHSWSRLNARPLQPRYKLPKTTGNLQQQQQQKSLSHQRARTSIGKTMATTPQGYQTSSENPNWLLPKLPPTPIDAKATSGMKYRRPRGLAPGGYAWHPDLGLWVPIDDPINEPDNFSSRGYTIENETEKSNNDSSGLSKFATQTTFTKNKTNSLLPEIYLFDSDSALEQPKIRNGFRVTTDGCLLPKKALKFNVDGVTYRRPHGHAPAGFDWNSLRGVWKPIEEAKEHKTKVDHLNEGDNDNVSPAEIDRPKIEEMVDHISTNHANAKPTKTHKGFIVLSNGCLQPKKDVTIDKDGTSYKRPHGASPAGFDWDPIRGVWMPIRVSDALRNVPKKKSHTASNYTASVMDDQPNILDDAVAYAVDVSKSNGESTDVGACNIPHINHDLIETYSGFLVLPDGCLLPKKDVKLGKNNTLYRRPHGASPAGFDWDAIRGVWKPTEVPIVVPVPMANTSNQTTEIHPKRSKAVTVGKQVYTKDFKARLKQLSKKGFIVDDDGCLLPKKGRAVDPKNPSLYKRPHGASPGMYRWNPSRGVWEPNGPIPVTQRLSRKSNNVATTAKMNALDDIDDTISAVKEPNEPIFAAIPKTSPQKFWKGFLILQDNCLAPKKKLKPERNGNDAHQMIWKRPHGAAPRGFNWDHVRGVWAPKNGGIDVATTDDTAVDKNVDVPVVVAEKAVATSPSLSEDQEIIQHNENEVEVQSSGSNQINGMTERHDYYPKRKRIKLQRYTPPIE